MVRPPETLRMLDADGHWIPTEALSIDEAVSKAGNLFPNNIDSVGIRLFRMGYQQCGYPDTHAARAAGVPTMCVP
eukprot:350699-Chlamydomonas_euryale.AAC.23